jgi:hypothetical protein
VDRVDVSLLVTFHREGILAHSSLNSIERCRRAAERTGITTEYVWVLDTVDHDTRKIISAHPAARERTRMIEVAHGDLGRSRNAGIAQARGRAVAILDGDDYYSTNWIEGALRALRDDGPGAIIHPEMVVNFGEITSYGWHIDQTGTDYDRAGLLANNYWTSWTVACREVYERVPYIELGAHDRGFGYEDWHWNCETIAAGFVHRIAPGTVGFYRRKKLSLVAATTHVGAVIPPTSLFSKKHMQASER